MTSEQAREILGVSITDSGEAIRNAYRDMAKVWHPDRFSCESESLKARAQTQMAAINDAYKVLTNSPRDGGAAPGDNYARTARANPKSDQGEHAWKPNPPRKSENASDARSDKWPKTVIGYSIIATVAMVCIVPFALLIFNHNSSSASSSSPAQQYALGFRYANGDGVPRDPAMAAHYYLKAAEQGYTDAQFALAWSCQSGEGVAKDLALAVSWYQRAAVQGHPAAMGNLGVLFYKGEGVAKDINEAVKWLRLSAEKGTPAAQNNLGNLYASGDGVPKDTNTAFSWYRLAADQGYGHAQGSLGEMYAKGEGVQRDLVAAYMWSNLGAAQGIEHAKTVRSNLELTMTPTQIAEAQQLSRDWRPKK
jgi:TPR repeat protein